MTTQAVGHTPGPWRLGDEGWSRGSILSATEQLIATIENLHNTDLRPESDANARLIAAAPELLNACELAVLMLGVEAQVHRENQAPKKAEAVEKAIEVICAAIAKATA